MHLFAFVSIGILIFALDAIVISETCACGSLAHHQLIKHTSFRFASDRMKKKFNLYLSTERKKKKEQTKFDTQNHFSVSNPVYG